MLTKTFLTLSVSVAAFASCAIAQLPYNPTRLILSPDKTKVYQFSSDGSFSCFYLSNHLTSTSDPISLDRTLSFLSTNDAYIPIADNTGVCIVSGDCQDATSDARVWRFAESQDGNNGTWKELELDSADDSLTAEYLSAGFTFSVNGSSEGSSLYVFGGMCPNGVSNISSWTSDATYSNTMFSISADSNRSPSQLSVTGTRAPPIAEAGLTITPLSLVSTKSSAGQATQQQNFVLLGGHTETAFINMSQIALFSLPEASWAFIDISQPGTSGNELARREDTDVSPRSGHTAVLTEDGSKIIVFGGWVGSVENPATPQLAVLEIGQQYGGVASWQWSIPTSSHSPLASNQGVYGHGAVMLPGDVMMVSGGVNIGTANQKRNTQNLMFYNTKSQSWSTTYRSPYSTSNGLDSAQKAGLGAGLGLGGFVVILILTVWLLYRRKLQKKRAERERHLRELAFGSDRHQSNSRMPSYGNERVGAGDVRSVSWGSRQEQQIESAGFKFPWSGQQVQNEKSAVNGEGSDVAERTGLEVPSPTRGLRRSLSNRGPPSFSNQAATVRGPGSVFRIDEVEEEGSTPPLRTESAAGSRLSDPFKDPPDLRHSSAAADRKREVQGWVDDWQSAAVSMNLSRNPSHARTYSNLSQAHSISDESTSFRTGCESPDKSDRTGSNLSERSAFSYARSAGTVSRQMSQRSVSAGYALFASAAAAMTRLSGAGREPALERTASRRSVSLNNSHLGTSVSSAQRPDAQSLLDIQPYTKPSGNASPVKDYSRTSSLTSQRKKAGILGSVKRVFTGTGNVDVQAQVDQYEEKSGDISPVKRDAEMSEFGGGPAFWQGKRGAKDWKDGDGEQTSSSHVKNRRSTMSATSVAEDDYEGEDWDVETAVQKRVVQVMFTVPKEKLRVVNADALSLMSRSDVDEREEKGELHRMDSVREDDNDTTDLEGKGKGKKVNG